MNRKPVLIDCDPGFDDAVALVVASACANIEIKAITCVAGNVGIAHTSRNALNLAALLGINCRVAVGAAGPVLGNTIEAAEVHGANGLGGLELSAAPNGFDAKNAYDVIYEEAVKAGGELEIIALGPLTNLAIAFAKFPDLEKYIKRITIMGGSATNGNVTPYAEFNFAADPYAAEMVLMRGVPILLADLDGCDTAGITGAELETIFAKAKGSGAYTVLSAFLQHAKVGMAAFLKSKGVDYDFETHKTAIYDAVTMCAALYPDVIEQAADYCVVCETRGEHAGRMIVDYKGRLGRPVNAKLITKISSAKYAQILAQAAEYHAKGAQ